MMIADTATRALVWKEFRQVVPLVGVVAVIGVSVTSINLLIDSFSPFRSGWGPIIAWVLPACFAAGVGALLVGHEKEQQTLDWLRALPNRPIRIITVKLLVAVVALAVLWLFALLLASVTGNVSSNTAVRLGISVPDQFGLLFPVQSLLVLICGFYAAWRTKHTFTGLLLLVPLACVPAIVNQLVGLIYRTTTGARLIPSGYSEWVLIGVSLAWMVVLIYLTFRAGLTVLSPAKAQQNVDTESLTRLHAWRPSVTTRQEAFRYPLSSLVWQYMQLHRMVLIAMSLVVVLGAYCMSLVSGPRSNADRSQIFETSVTSIVLAAGLAASWLGVLAFAGDGHASRLRFLADRGVSPLKVWLGRHVVAISLLSVGVLSYFVSIWWNLSADWRGEQRPSLTSILFLVWTIYWMSQWVSQSIPILAGAAIVAPILSVIAIAWAIYSATNLGAPFWLLFLCSLLPITVTCLSMRRYMDGQRDWISIAQGLLVPIAWLVIPAFPFALRVANYKDISTPRKSEMLAAAAKLTSVETSYIRLALTPANGIHDSIFMSEKDMLASYEATRFGPRSHFEWRPLEDPQSNAYIGGSDVVHMTIDSATFARVDFELSPTDDKAKLLGDWITAITEFATGLRNSHWLDDQHAADLLEIWLVDALGSESIQELRIEFAPVVELLGDPNRRSRGRRDAVLASWSRAIDQRKNQTLTHSIDRAFWNPSGIAQPMSQLIQNKRINRIAAALLDLIKAAENSTSLREPLDRLSRLSNGTDWESNGGPFSDHARANITLVDTKRSSWYSPHFGSLWYASWEAEAAEIADQLRDRTQQNSQLDQTSPDQETAE